MKLEGLGSTGRRGGRRLFLWWAVLPVLAALAWLQAVPASASPTSVLSVNKFANPSGGTVVSPGQAIEYTIEYKNNSSETLPVAALKDTLSEKVTYQPGSLTLNGTPLSDEGHFDPDTRTISADIGPVAAGVRGTLRFKVVVGPWELSRSGFFNVATWSECGEVMGSTPPLNHFVDSLDVTKSVTNTSGSVLHRGDTLLWSIVVTNRGIAPATEVLAEDVVPDNTTYVDDSITGPGSDASQLPRLIWRVGTLGVGQSVTLTFKSKVNSNVASGTVIANNASVSSCQGPPKTVTASTTPVVVETPIVPVNTAGNEGISLAVMGLLALGAFGMVRSNRWQRTGTTLLLIAALIVGGVEAGGSFAGASSSRVSGNRVSIPSAGINVRLVEGRTMTALKSGTWRQPPSALPGQAGTCVIAGHRIPSQFRPLAKARVGSLVYVKTGGVTHTYRIVSKSVLSAAHGKLVFKKGTRERLILYTCVPKWQGNKRTVVVCDPVK